MLKKYTKNVENDIKLKIINNNKQVRKARSGRVLNSGFLNVFKTII